MEGEHKPTNNRRTRIEGKNKVSDYLKDKHCLKNCDKVSAFIKNLN